MLTLVSGERKRKRQRYRASGAKPYVAQERSIAGVQTESIEPWLNAQPWHAVGTLVGPLAKQLVRRFVVAEACVDRGNFVRAEISVLRRFLHLPDDGGRLGLPARDRKDVRLQRPNGQAVVQLHGSLQVVEGFVEAALLRIGDTLKGQCEPGARLELQPLSSELDRFVVVPCEQQEDRALAWVRIDRGSRLSARRISWTA